MTVELESNQQQQQQPFIPKEPLEPKENNVDKRETVPWIVIDGIDINDILKNQQLKDDICMLNQQLCKDFGTASLVLAMSSESPIKSQREFSDVIDNNIWIGQFESRQIAYQYLKMKLSHLIIYMK